MTIGHRKFINCIHRSFVVAILAVAMLSCRDDNARGDASVIDRFDQVAVEYDLASPEQADSLVEQYGDVIDVLSRLYPDTSAAAVMKAYSHSEAQKFFYDDVKTRLGDLSQQEQILGVMQDNFGPVLPNDVCRFRFVGIITPYNQSVMVSDSMVLIGLNHYLGEDYKPYEVFPIYQRKLKTPRRMVWDVAEAIVTSRHPYQGNGSLLSRMLYDGAIVNVVMKILKEKDFTIATGWDKDQLLWASDNEQRVWQTMVGGDMLFDRSDVAADKLLSPSPASTLINPSAPGRIGRYIGWRIVNQYLKHHRNVDYEWLLSTEFYDENGTLSEAKYVG